jgi:PPOX class probable F420-dependent enzyme
VASEAPRPEVFAALAAEQYVLLTTTRRNGVTVATPVWVAPHDHALVVTTGAEAGKVKRVRHTPRVTLQACDRVGKPLEGAPVVDAHATVHDDEQSMTQLEAALSAKYGVQYAAIKAMSKLRGRRAPGSVMVRLVNASP